VVSGPNHVDEPVAGSAELLTRLIPRRRKRCMLRLALDCPAGGWHKLELLYGENRGGVKQYNTIYCMTLRASTLGCTGIAAVEHFKGEEGRGGRIARAGQ
jgi:hypothetical protein